MHESRNGAICFGEAVSKEAQAACKSRHFFITASAASYNPLWRLRTVRLLKIHYQIAVTSQQKSPLVYRSNLNELIIALKIADLNGRSVIPAGLVFRLPAFGGQLLQVFSDCSASTRRGPCTFGEGMT